MSDPADSDHEFDLLEQLRDAEAQERRKPYIDPDDYHDELIQEDENNG